MTQAGKWIRGAGLFVIALILATTTPGLSGADDQCAPGCVQYNGSHSCVDKCQKGATGKGTSGCWRPAMGLECKTCVWKMVKCEGLCGPPDTLDTRVQCKVDPPN